jgi:integrase
MECLHGSSTLGPEWVLIFDEERFSMPKHAKPLTARQLEKWRPDPVRTLERVDGAVPGLRVRLSPDGRSTWSLSIRVDGVRRRIAIGKGLGLAEARRTAEQTRVAIARGEDPGGARRARAARRRAAARGVGTLGAVIAAFYEQGPGSVLRSGAASRALVERAFARHLTRPSVDVLSAELQLAADECRSKSSAKRIVSSFRPLMRWAVKRGLMTKGDPLEAPRQDPPKQLVLKGGEVGALLRALDGRYGAAARFMLLTAARCQEVCGATWGEIKEGLWTIKGERRKNTRPNAKQPMTDHVLALPRQARSLLDQLKPREPDELIFPDEREARLTNWTNWSAQMEQRLGFEVTPHALRRTCSTIAGDLGHPPHVVSALLGHRTIGGGLHDGYNQSRYRRDVAAALQDVADWLDTLTAGEDNLVAIRRRA